MKTYLTLLLAIAAVCACAKKEESTGPVETGPTGNVEVSWTANREADVNSAGGGYRVYYASAPNVDTATAPYVDVPYVSGASAPVTARLNLGNGTHYIRVVAYSAYNPNGLAAGNRSADSSEVSVAVSIP